MRKRLIKITNQAGKEGFQAISESFRWNHQNQHEDDGQGSSSLQPVQTNHYKDFSEGLNQSLFITKIDVFSSVNVT